MHECRIVNDGKLNFLLSEIDLFFTDFPLSLAEISRISCSCSTTDAGVGARLEFEYRRKSSSNKREKDFKQKIMQKW